MSLNQPKFSHVPYATDYMRKSIEIIGSHFGSLNGRKILDIPAGNGWVTAKLRLLGADVTAADINEEKPEYVQANMEKPLPFEDEVFDAVISLEGIEHVLNPYDLFSELSRVLKPGGVLIISTPNVQSFFSRYQFFCTGYLFQFDPFNKVPPAPGEICDRGHVSPIFYTQLRYYSELHGLEVQQPTGGRKKKFWAIIIFWPFILIGFVWALKDWCKTSRKPEPKKIIPHLFSIKTLFSRSLIFIAIKKLNS